MAIIFCIVITAFAVNGLSIATQPGQLLAPVKQWLSKRIGKNKLYKPLIDCVRCMPSIYGTIICIIYLPCDETLIYSIPIVILCSSTLASIIHTLYP